MTLQHPPAATPRRARPGPARPARAAVTTLASWWMATLRSTWWRWQRRRVPAGTARRVWC